MVYGSADFMGIPWETIIKMFRRELGSRPFDRVEQYADCFLAYLTDSIAPLVGEPERRNLVAVTANSYLGYLENLVAEKCVEQLQQDAHSCGRRVKQLVDDVVDAELLRWRSKPYFTGYEQVSVRRIKRAYADVIEEQIQSYFAKAELYKKTRAAIVEVVAQLIAKDVPSPYQSGVVIAGFGVMDLFPCLRSYLIDGIVLDRVKCKGDKKVDVKPDMKASITPFAEVQVVASFMEGVDPLYLEQQYGWLKQTFSDLPNVIANQLPQIVGADKTALVQISGDVMEEMLKEFVSAFADHRRKNYWWPIVNRVSAMPKEELAALAEALVNLTALKRKVSDDHETVGGPVDVAVISKGDGLIWIKRKHYFTPDLNQHFIANCYRREQ